MSSITPLGRGFIRRENSHLADVGRLQRLAMLSGDVETGKTILRDYINATVGFEKLGAATGAPPKSLIRMFGPRGNPQAKNLFSVIGYLQKQAGLHLHVTRG